MTTTFSSKPDIKFFVLPISGNLFSFQLGQVIFYINALRKAQSSGQIEFSTIPPDIIFSASGGNIVGYVCHANDWNPESMISSFRFIDSQAFLTSWITPLSYLFFKSIFSRGYGFEPFLNYFYDPCKRTGVSQKLKKGTEILTGVVCNNKKTKKNTYKIFSNKDSYRDSILTYNDSPTDHTGCLTGSPAGPYSGSPAGPYSGSPSGCCKTGLDLKCEQIDYLKGNVKEVSEIILDSASIPFIIKERCIEESEGTYHSDAGTMYASTFSVLSHKLFESNKILKGFFFNPEYHRFCVAKNNTVNILCEMKNLISTTYSHEIRTFISLITSFGGMTPFSEPLVYENVTVDFFKGMYLDLESTNYHYGVIFCLSKHLETSVNLFTFLTEAQLYKDIENSSCNVTCFVWRKI